MKNLGLSKSVLQDWTPPIIWRLLKKLSRLRPSPEYEYVSRSWEEAASRHLVKGWNVPEVVETYRTKWSAFEKSLAGTQPLGLSPEASSNFSADLSFQNTLLCFAHSLNLVCHQNNRVTMLDWGGGIGHYYRYAQVLFPQVQFEYTCKDVSLLVDFGRKLFPEAHFVSDDECFAQEYDFVLASSSLQYSPDWRRVLGQLAAASRKILYITRLPTIKRDESFVFLQRAYRYGFNTEYLAWCLNQAEFMDEAAQHDLKLQREFLIGESPCIYRAPGPCEYRGYLFQRQRMKLI